MAPVSPAMRSLMVAAAVCLSLGGCRDKDVDASGSDDLGEHGDVCGLGVEGDEPPCSDGLACEPTVDADGQPSSICAAPLLIRGIVSDALTGVPLPGAHVSALDETGAPVSDVAVSGPDGAYELQVSARRDPDGEIVDAIRWTLFATAADYQPFPAGLRPAIPVNAVDAVTEEDEHVQTVIENASTDVALLQLPESERGGRTISGSVGATSDVDGDGRIAGAGTLVVAEGTIPAPYTIADASGEFTLFNVPEGAVTVVGYRQGLRTTATIPDGDADAVLVAIEIEGNDELPTVSGSVQIVNAPGNSVTSVVLVPVSVYNEALERGPVPFGLRAPTPPDVPSVTGGFSIAGVPPGTYKVLAAFENDNLVRDPDEGIGGTNLQEITVAMDDMSVDESFKVTEDIAVVSPGAEVPEVVEQAPTLVFADDSSEDYYHVVVRDAFGDLVWEDPQVPRVTGSSTVEVAYGGPALRSGMYYQFRATSFRDRNQGPTPISRTEDLRGVFIGP